MHITACNDSSALLDESAQEGIASSWEASKANILTVEVNTFVKELWIASKFRERI